MKLHLRNRRLRSHGRIPLLTGGGLALLLACMPQLAIPIATSAAAVVQASCYDAYYFDGLTSRYSASHCAAAANGAGYSATAYDNTSAQTAAANSARDGVFFMAGHSLDLFENNCSPSCSGPHSGVGLAFESPDSSGNLDALASDPITAAELSGALVEICTEGGGCRVQTVFAAYPWGDTPQNFKANLVVLEACATTQDTTGFTSIGTTVFDAGAGTVVGFNDDIAFPVGSDETNTYGDGWANRFWSDLGAGETYTSAALDASAFVGNANGYGSVAIKQNAGAPQTLAPAQYFVF